MRFKLRFKYWLVALLTVFLISSPMAMAQLFKQPPRTPGLQAPGRVFGRFEFALIGDLPYDTQQEAQFSNLVEDINRSTVSFVVHDGDFKSGSTSCSDQVFFQRRNLFQTFRQPFFFIFGDNEWTDCHRDNNGGFDPLERLAKLRELFAQGNQSLGQRTLPLSRQSENPRYQKFRENIRWKQGDVWFVGLHVVGSNNNLGRSTEADAEYAERNLANLAWLRESFALAKRESAKGMVLILQANPNFELKPEAPERSGFNDLINALETEVINYEGHVALVHGDTHTFQIDKPLIGSKSKRRLENFTRVETFGSPDVHWVLGVVDPTDPNLFRFEPRLVTKNLVNHR